MAAGKRYKRFAGHSVNNAGYHNENWDRFHGGNELRDVSYDSLADAITDIGTSTSKTLYITTSHRITRNTTIPSNISVVRLQGGGFTSSNGSELTIEGPFTSPLSQAFFGNLVVSGLYQGHPEWFGPFATATQRTAALVLAIAACEHIIISGDEYDPLNVTVAGRSLWMQPAVTFKIPNGAITTTPGTPALKISADNTTIFGDFEVDGNVANQSTGGFSSAQRTGTLAIVADNCRIDGHVTLNNSFWVGLQMEGGSTSGSEVTNIYVRSLYIYNPGYYAFMPWTVDTWRIENIEVVLGPNSTDARVRTGTQTITGECLNGYIGSLKSTQSLVVEKRTRKLHIDNLNCGAFKTEDAADITVNTATLRGQYYDQTSSRVSINSLTIDGFDDAGAALPTVNINTSGLYVPGNPYTGGGLYIGTMTLKDTVSASNQVQVRTCYNVVIGRIYCINPDPAVAGILFDYDAGFAPQANVWVGSVFAEGHAGYDIQVQNGFDNIHIWDVNFSAVRSNNFGGPTVVGNGGWYLDTLSVTGQVNFKSEIEFGDTTVTSATLKTGTRSALPTNTTSVWVYSTVTNAGSYPFDAFGHLVLQPRSDSPRDIAFLTCISPATTPTVAGAFEEAGGSSRFALYRNLFMAETRNFILGTVTGTQMGTAANQKYAEWGATPVVQPASANQAAVSAPAAFVNTDGAIGGLAISAAYSQAEVQALRDAVEVLADDCRALRGTVASYETLLTSIRSALVVTGRIKGSA